ncbi:WD repeat-containing protein 88-like [Dysidea avara]|uniref:WD repeat-containing protein 88-like n=1 Tax=Dysidea avara TaxID=196820 RepID=UPI00333271F0
MDSTSNSTMEVSTKEDHSDKERITEFRAHKSQANCCQLFHNDQHLVTCSDDNTVALWDAVSGRNLTSVKAHEHNVVSCSVDETNNRVLTGSWDKSVCLWDIETETKLWSQVYDSLVTCCCLGSYVVSTVDKSIYLHDPASGQLISTAKGHSNTVMGCSLSSRGTELCSTSMDKTAKVWDTRMLHILLNLKGHINVVSSSSFSYDSHYVATASWDKTVQLYDIATGIYRSEGPAILRHHEGSVSSCAFSRDGSLLVSGGYDLNINVYNTGINKLKLGLKGHTSWVNCVSTGEDRKWIASCSKDGMVKVWNTEHDAVEHSKQKKKKKVFGIDMARCYICGKQFARCEEPSEHMQCVFCRLRNPSRTFMDQVV